MGNYFSEINCMKASVITEINNDTSEEVKKYQNIAEQVKEPNPICDKKECCDIEDCCKNKEFCNKEDCSRAEECCDKK